MGATEFGIIEQPAIKRTGDTGFHIFQNGFGLIPNFHPAGYLAHFLALAGQVAHRVIYDMAKFMNQLVTFKGVTVEAYDESGAAFAYKDPEGKTDDLYFKATLGDTTYEFCVEFYLRGTDTDVYKAVEALQAGDVVDLTGYL